ncbi:cdc42 effector protein 1-like [Cyprinus carpio]|uniref:Cdc42 effector protein 1-like n=1 Tax=Cyprinus carpio TaxID=7962 RepID=A0A9Q9ZSP9_CYPCA|nr:cdc42 effector protein 1-like [Cyprinus carpio]XP_018925584.1 cdc42 effector protein 1-like [Cyprinus carpio]XP_018925588.1 cdc42 effector protein 1-like [Cyprinus carpio]XP_042572554.1 cdc42 effector protein 1-like [Cyprinus carpio]XP_042572559.1 cdc42 effector protein 1-like [Cyprinus carpio]
MSLGKLPAIKGLVSTSHGKRRFKSDLSVDMISPPLGDFRHTMHVGRGGDVFGDTSFLSNYGGSSNSEGIRYPDSPSGSKPTRFLSRTLQHVRKTPLPRLRGGSRDFSSPPPPISPIIKNAISLPQLNMNDGGLMRALLPTSTSSPDEPLCSYGLHSGFVTLPRSSRLDQSFAETSEMLSSDSRRSSLPENSEVSMTRSDSLSSFTVDLGPSLMSEVLELIDSSCCLIRSHQDQEEEEEEEGQQSSVFEMDHECQTAPIGADITIEPRRFQQAASVLARHFGGGRPEEESQRPSSFRHTRTPYSFTETEDEIKV